MAYQFISKKIADFTFLVQTLSLKHFGLSQDCSFGSPFKRSCSLNKKKCNPTYFAGDDVSVTAVSVRQRNSRFILQKSHLQTTVVAISVVRLSKAPGEVVGDLRDLRA
jgi:hypothetical protein